MSMLKFRTALPMIREYDCKSAYEYVSDCTFDMQAALSNADAILRDESNTCDMYTW